LLELGAEAHAVGATREVGSALHLAASACDRGTAELLLAALASPFLAHLGATPLDAAAAAGDAPLCRRLEGLGLFAAWVHQRQAPGLLDSALGRERWERRWVAVVPRYSAAPQPQQGVLCALQLRVTRRESDAAPLETHTIKAARMTSAHLLEVLVLAQQAERVLLFSCAPPGVFPEEGGSAAAAAQRTAQLLAACTSRAPPRVPLSAAAARRAAGLAPPAAPPAVATAASAFPSPPAATADAAAEAVPAMQVTWQGSQAAPRSTRSGGAEPERLWPTTMQLRCALPALQRAADCVVAASGQEFTLHAPGLYRCRVQLPFPVAAANGISSAVFDTQRRTLTLDLTVLCVPRDPPAQQQGAQQQLPPPLPPRRAPPDAPSVVDVDEAAALDSDLEEAIRRSLADVAVPPAAPSAPPLPTWAAAAPAAPSAPPSAPPAAFLVRQEEQEEASLCIICLTDKRTVGLLHGSSMHVVACAGCAPRLMGSPCPLCRAPVERLVQIYS